MRRAILAFIALLAMVRAASAEPPPEEQARALNRRGVELLEQRDFLGALEAFRAAYDRYPSVKILLNIGTVSRNLGRNVEAADAYERYLGDPAADPQKKREITAALQKLDAGLAKIRIDVDPSDARCFLDGKPVGASPVRVEPGTHGLVAEKDGFVSRSEMITVAASEERKVQLRLAAKPAIAPAPPPSPAPAPLATPPAPAIAHVEPDQGNGRRKTLIWSLGGAGLAVMSAGVYFGLSARSDWNDVEAHCPNRLCTDPVYVTRAGDASRSANVSTVCFLVGGTTVAAAAVLWWRQSRAEAAGRSARVHVIPMAGSGFAGALVEGSLP